MGLGAPGPYNNSNMGTPSCVWGPLTKSRRHRSVHARACAWLLYQYRTRGSLMQLINFATSWDGFYNRPQRRSFYFWISRRDVVTEIRKAAGWQIFIRRNLHIILYYRATARDVRATARDVITHIETISCKIHFSMANKTSMPYSSHSYSSSRFLYKWIPPHLVLYYRYAS